MIAALHRVWYCSLVLMAPGKGIEDKDNPLYFSGEDEGLASVQGSDPSSR